MLMGTSDPYCVCEIHGKPGSRFETKVLFDTVNPVWDHEEVMSDWCPGDSLTFTLFDRDLKILTDDKLGEATLDSRQFVHGFNGGLLLNNGEGATLMLRIRPIKHSKRTLSELPHYFKSKLWSDHHHHNNHHEHSISTPHSGHHPDEQSLKVTIKQATGLKNMDWMPGHGSNMGCSDPYCTCEILGKPETRIQTPVQEETLSPVWNYHGQFSDYHPGDSLVFAVWDQDWGKHDDFLGSAELPAMHFDPVAFDGEIQLSDTASTAKLQVRVEMADFETTLGVTTVTGLGIRRKLWATWSKYAKIPVTNSEDQDVSISGFHMRRRLRNAPGEMAKVLRRKKLEAKLALIDMVWSRREQVMRAMRDALKEVVTADPDMCRCLRHSIHKFIEHLWNDIRLEVEIMVEATRVGIAGHSMHDVKSLAEEGWEAPCCLHPLALRGFFLYHALPYDKSFLGQVKDPFYLVFLVLSFIPVVRCMLYLVVLLLFINPGPPDEYQLVQYIMVFKAAQFISSGVVLASYGIWKYFWCVQGTGRHNCIANGPGESSTFGSYYGPLGVVDIVGCCVLVWSSFLLLPYSKQCAGLRKTETYEDDSDDELQQAESARLGEERTASMRCFCPRLRRRYRFQYEGRGGRLGGLLRYDLYCFCAIVVVLVLLEIMRYGEDPSEYLNAKEWRTWDHMKTWEFRETLFVVRVMYGWTGLPFTVFTLPVLDKILTHTVPTGFNQRGAVVAYLLPPVEQSDSESDED